MPAAGFCLPCFALLWPVGRYPLFLARSRYSPVPAALARLPCGGVRGFADGAAADAQFNCPYSVAVDGDGNVHVADRENS